MRRVFAGIQKFLRSSFLLGIYLLTTVMAEAMPDCNNYPFMDGLQVDNAKEGPDIISTAEIKISAKGDMKGYELERLRMKAKFRAEHNILFYLFDPVDPAKKYLRLLNEIADIQLSSMKISECYTSEKEYRISILLSPKTIARAKQKFNSTN